MRINLFLNGMRPGMMDLDRKLPDVIKLYPDAKIKKIDYLGRETIHGKDIVKGIKAVKFMGAKIDSDLRLDIYARDIFCYSYFCVSFDIGGIELPKNANDFGEQIKDIEVSIDGEAGSLPLLIMKYVVPYYDVDKAIEIDKKIDADELSELTSNLETIANKVISENIEPEPQSGQQEYLENILNKYL